VSNETKTAFLFPGQGAQSIGMGVKLAESVPAAADLFARASEILGYDLLEVCANGPAEKLNSTAYSQPALFVTSLAAVEKLRAESPDVVASCQLTAGLSLGEYTAMVFAEAMDFAAGLKVVQTRGEAMQAAADENPSTMVSVLGLENEKLAELCEEARCDDVLQIANYLCPGNTAVSGHKPACERLTELANTAGAMKVIPLAVAGAFHTPLMQSAVEKLKAVLADVEIQSPRIPVISNVDAQPHSQPEDLRDILIRQVVGPVRWEESMRNMVAEGTTQFYELGPGRVLRGLLRRIDRQLPCENVIG